MILYKLVGFMQYIILILLRAVDIYSYLLLAYALLSWFPSFYQTGLGRGLARIVDPLLKPFRKLNLQFAGFDFTVMAAILALQMGTRLLLQLLFSLV